MGLILDLAVVALGLVVIGSLALLAWTLAVPAVRAVREERARVAEARRRVTAGEARLREASTRAGEAMAPMVARTRPAHRRLEAPGDTSDR